MAAQLAGLPAPTLVVVEAKPRSPTWRGGWGPCRRCSTMVVRAR